MEFSSCLFTITVLLLIAFFPDDPAQQAAFWAHLAYAGVGAVICMSFYWLWTMYCYQSPLAWIAHKLGYRSADDLICELAELDPESTVEHHERNNVWEVRVFLGTPNEMCFRHVILREALLLAKRAAVRKGKAA